MAQFAVIYTYGVDSGPGRDEVRPEHRAWLGDRADEGLLAIAGPWAPGEPAGALLLVNGDDADSVRELMSADPFQREGFVTDVTIHEWTPATGYLGEHF